MKVWRNSEENNNMVSGKNCLRQIIKYLQKKCSIFYSIVCCAAKQSLVAQTVKNLPTVQESKVRSLCQEDPLEKGMATHSSILAWKIPWTEEPGRVQSMGLHRVGHD